MRLKEIFYENCTLLAYGKITKDMFISNMYDAIIESNLNADVSKPLKTALLNINKILEIAYVNYTTADKMYYKLIRSEHTADESIAAHRRCFDATNNIMDFIRVTCINDRNDVLTRC